MTKMLKILLPVLGVTLGNVSIAQDNSALCNYGHETVSNVTCFGPADLNGTTVTGNVFVTGPVTMTDVTANDVEIMGVLNSSNSKFNGTVKIYGPLHDENSVFYQGVVVATNYMSLNGSNVRGNITEKSQQENAVLKMVNKSHVIGDVIFSAYPGEVEMDQSSLITGHVVNGKKVPIN